MLLSDACELIRGPRRYTLVLEVGHDLYTIHHRDDHFILAVMHGCQDSRRLVECADWQAFLAKVPDDIKTRNTWFKQ